MIMAIDKPLLLIVYYWLTEVGPFCKSQVSLKSLHSSLESRQTSPKSRQQVQVKLQVLNFKLQVLNKSLVLLAQSSVSVLITTVNLKSLIVYSKYNYKDIIISCVSLRNESLFVNKYRPK